MNPEVTMSPSILRTGAGKLCVRFLQVQVSERLTSAMALAAVSASRQVLRGTTGIFTSHSASLLSRAPALCARPLNRRMTSQRKTDHLERTANTFREEIISPAKICGITNESSTVKRVRLAVENSEFTFKAGQWGIEQHVLQYIRRQEHARSPRANDAVAVLYFGKVDFFIPGVPKVGGFSICSSPGLLEREGVLELAVKYNLHPPAHWIHAQCSLGSEVALRVGGEFFFDPQASDSPVDLVLIAGGVGINPLFSILLHVADLHKALETTGKGFQMGSVRLYYCAKNTSELLFKKNILNLIHSFPGKITCSFHVTQQSSEVCTELQPFITEGRISESHLANSVSRDHVCYICGPPPMIESVCKQLENLHVPREQIYFEKWW
ncbi:oxidoreductase NAD-binding domain-containing protein 1 isoform X2 [Dendrobates tinctorius]|uniref:oxidoreductase NAD-binding domain-containing protein 1 isoform X2 n=1 Tax=Dendrobates tinctorius TaxID=92724 RepID=UPI003CCA5FB8